LLLDRDPDVHRVLTEKVFARPGDRDDGRRVGRGDRVWSRHIVVVAWIHA
jgi:hypothetical protein